MKLQFTVQETVTVTRTCVVIVEVADNVTTASGQPMTELPNEMLKLLPQQMLRLEEKVPTNS